MNLIMISRRDVTGMIGHVKVEIPNSQTFQLSGQGGCTQGASEQQQIFSD